MRLLKYLRKNFAKAKASPIQVEIVEVKPAPPLGSLITFKLENKTYSTIAFKFESVEEAIQNWFKHRRDFENWFQTGFQKHKENEGKKVNILV